MNALSMVHAAAKVFLIRRKIVFAAALDQIREATPRVPVVYRLGHASDAGRLSASLYAGDKEAERYTAERLAAGDELILGERDGEIVFSGWAMFGQLDLGVRHLIPIGPASVASYRLLTRADQRGNRLCSAYFTFLRNRLCQQGYGRIVSWVEARNEPSLKLHDRAGFERIGSIWQVRILSRSYFLIPRSTRRRLQPMVDTNTPAAETCAGRI